ncbi:MAG: V-type ATP synthase subunit D [Lentisphaerae bacterium]|nr:V-type ATP synthase subunit D [Lentisphaerota bacterium]
MPRIKHTKNELKAQREALSRYERYLPMLQLKKQQLQTEIRAIEAGMAALRTETEEHQRRLQPWIRLLSEPLALQDLVALEAVETEEGNIAGVSIPVLREVKVRQAEADLFLTPAWVDDAVAVLASLIRLRAETAVRAEQRRRIREELRVTTQRVNLFEKVKIPECRENIRVIKIFLGDEQTAGVARAKLAKGRLEASLADATA